VIDRFCGKVAETLRRRWISPEERGQTESEDKRRAENEERTRQDAEAKRRADEQAKVLEILVKTFGEGEGRKRAEDEAGKGAEEWRVQHAPARGRSPAPARASFVEFRVLLPGASFRDVSAAPQMIVVPRGRFLMGSPAGQGDDDARPQHEVTIAKPFAVAKFALTFDEWDACAAEGGCRRDVSDSGWGRGRRPVINVSWDDAQVYIKWLSGITGKPYRLLSEAEYEYAARAKSQTAYPWGDGIKLNGELMANCDGCGSQWDGEQTAPVGSFPANAFGLYDMVGNVWERTEDCWNPRYEGAPPDGSPWKTGDCRLHVVRGGSWVDISAHLGSARRLKATANHRVNTLGFRVALTLTP
jgi:formylglycine-generating enzyme required for sulfatase activity